MFLADFHTHTNKSDGKLPLRELIDLYGKRGFGAIAVTDHVCENSLIGNIAKYLDLCVSEKNFSDYLEELEEEAARAWREYRMLVIPGVEISKNYISNRKSAHILVLGIKQFINPDLEVSEIHAEVKRQGGLMIAAHPVSTRKIEKQTYYLWDKRDEYAQYFDAWEVASGPYLFDEVLHSGLPMIASSDLHVAKQIESWKTVLHCDRDKASVFSAIQKQELSFSYYSRTEESVASVLAAKLNPASWANLRKM